jgi:hypothetical protein
MSKTAIAPLLTLQVETVDTLFNKMPPQFENLSRNSSTVQTLEIA